MEELRKAYAWREALDLSKQLVRMCEEFSDSDTNVVAYHLRQAVIDIPASVAVDLQNGKKANMEPVVRLMTGLELVRKIYPAIDTSAVDSRLDTLLERMQGKAFAEREPDPEEEMDEAEANQVSEPEVEVEPAPKPAGGTVVRRPKMDGVRSGVTSIDITSD